MNNKPQTNHKQTMQSTNTHNKTNKRSQGISVFAFLSSLSFLAGEPESIERPLGKVFDEENKSSQPETGEVILPGRLYFKPVEPGVNLQQTLEDMLDDPLIKQHYARQAIVTDYQQIVGYDRLRDEHVSYSLAELEAMSEAERNEPMKFFCTLMGLERELFPSARA